MSLNPFNEEYDSTSAMIYTFIPLLFVLVSNFVMLVYQVSGQCTKIPIVLVMLIMGYMLGFMLSTILITHFENDHKNIKKSSFYGYIAMFVGFLVYVLLKYQTNKSGSYSP